MRSCVRTCTHGSVGGRELSGSLRLDVDFLIKQGLDITGVIQLSHDLEAPDTKRREIRAALAAAKNSAWAGLQSLLRMPGKKRPLTA